MFTSRLSFALVCCCLVAQSALADDRVPVRVASLPAAIAPPSKSDAIAASTASLTRPVSDLDGHAALTAQIDRLQSILGTLNDVTCYTAEMTKQERIGGDLSKEQRITLKLRHADEESGIAKSIYMKWLSGDRGREVIYVDGQNSGKMLVHAGGWKARILPVLSLDPSGSIAMSEARHPITEAGLKHLAQRWLTVRKSDLSLKDVKHSVQLATFDGREAVKFMVEYADPSQYAEYRKSELWIDVEKNVPVASVNYAWSVEKATDAETLVERYEYRDLELNAGLEDIDFDRTNRRYAFRN